MKKLLSALVLMSTVYGADSVIDVKNNWSTRTTDATFAPQHTTISTITLSPPLQLIPGKEFNSDQDPLILKFHFKTQEAAEQSSESFKKLCETNFLSEAIAMKTPGIYSRVARENEIVAIITSARNKNLIIKIIENSPLSPDDINLFLVNTGLKQIV